MLYCRLGWSISGTKGRQYQIFLDTRFKNKNTMQSTNVREYIKRMKDKQYTDIQPSLVVPSFQQMLGQIQFQASHLIELLY